MELAFSKILQGVNDFLMLVSWLNLIIWLQSGFCAVKCIKKFN
jgi:hypothetical protein